MEEIWKKIQIDEQYLDNILSQARSVNHSSRKQAEDDLSKLSSVESNSTYAQFIYKLAQILADEKYSTENRQLSTIILKNQILLLDEKAHVPKWTLLDYHCQTLITNLLLASLASKNAKVRSSAGILISTICSIEFKANNVRNNALFTKQILNSLINATHQQDNQIVTTSIETINFILEDLPSCQFDQHLLDDILFLLMNILSTYDFTTDLLNVIKSSLKCFRSILPFSNEQFNCENKRTKILATFLSLLESLVINQNKKQFNILIELSVQCLIDICSRYYSQIESFMTLIASITLHLISTLDQNISDEERIILFSLEVWCSIGDKEILLSIEGKKYFIIHEEALTNTILAVLLISPAKNIKESDECSVQKACAYILCLLVQLAENSSYLEKLLVYVDKNFNSSEEHCRFTALILLSCCLETIHKEKLSNLLHYNLENYIRTLWDKSELVSYASSWLFAKMTELFGNIFDKKMLYKYVPLLIGIIKDSNDGVSDKVYNVQSRINLSFALCNIIKFHGDPQTRYNSNPIGPYYSLIIDPFLKMGCNICTCNSSFSFYILQVVLYIIQYSSLDFQDILEDLLEKLIDYFNAFNKEEKENNNTTITFHCQVQEYICMIIHQVYLKIIRQVRSDINIKAYSAIVKSFKIRNNSTYEYGISCICNIVTNLHEEFASYIQEFIGFLKISLMRKDDYLLCKASLISISTLLCSLIKHCQTYGEDFMQIILQFLIDESVHRLNKLDSFSALSDICLNIPAMIPPNFNSLMSIIFSACEISLNGTEKVKK